jgi:hypothetical protein
VACGRCAAVISKDMECDAASRLPYEFARCPECERVNALYS